MINVIHVQEPAELFCMYDGQFQPQSCYVELDLQDGTLSAGYNAEIGNAVPSAVYHGHVRRYLIPCLRGDIANQLLDTLAPLAERVITGYVSSWNGHAHIAALTDDAQDADHAINAAIVDSYYSDDDCVQYANASDWLDEICSEIQKGLAAGETVDTLVSEMRGDGTEEFPILIGLREYLESLNE